MKHSKKILALAMSIAVVASIAAAGTLAYLTSTQTVTNNFTLGTSTKGQVAITLDETDLRNGNTDSAVRTSEGNDYEGLLPGKVLIKDPIVHVDANSADSYLFVAVKTGFGQGVDKNNAPVDVAQFLKADGTYGTLEQAITSQGWVKIEAYPTGVTAPTGYDIYVKGTADEYATVTAGSNHNVFAGMKINGDLASLGTDGALVNNKTVEIKAFAIQADNLGENPQTVALTEAVGALTFA